MKKARAAKTSPPEPAKPDPNSVAVHAQPGETPGLTMANFSVGPHLVNAVGLQAFAKGVTGAMYLPDIVGAMMAAAKKVNSNDLKDIEAMLSSQALLLNALSADLVRRSAINFGEHFEAGQKFLALALKAQNQCRMTLETLANIKNPPVVYAQQANIATGPQQVNNGAVAIPRARETGNAPNKILEASNEQRMDTGTSRTAGGSNSAVEAVATGDGAKVG